MRAVSYLISVLMLLTGCATPSAATSIPARAEAIIKHYRMNKIPHEGPWFLQTHKSDDVVEGVLADRYPSVRYAYTATYAVTTREEFSAMHRLATDELWHFYGGSPSEILLLYPGGSGEVKVFGSDVLAGQHPQIMVPRGTWMGARPVGEGSSAYTFAANTLSPGFEYEDYEIGYRDELTDSYPKFSEKIVELTRNDSLTRPKGIAKISPARISVEELVGRQTPQRSSEISVAKFTIQAATTTPFSLNVDGEEIIVIESGRGIVTVGSKETTVRKGSVVHFPAGVRHKVEATTHLVLHAVVAPAYSITDNVVVPND